MKLKQKDSGTLVAEFAAKFWCVFVLILPVFVFGGSESSISFEDTTESPSPQIYVAKDAVIGGSDFIYTSENFKPEISASENKVVPTVIYVAESTVISGPENLQNARITYISSFSKEKKIFAKSSKKIYRHEKSIGNVDEKGKASFTANLGGQKDNIHFRILAGSSSCSGTFSNYYKFFSPECQKFESLKLYTGQSAKVFIRYQSYIISIYPNTAGIRPPPQNKPNRFLEAC